MSKVLITQVLGPEFDPQNPQKKPGRMLRAFNTKTEQAETVLFLEWAG